VGRLDDKVAVVTGAARGLGRAVAEAYAAEGATVVVSDVDGEGAGRVADALGGRGVSAVCDVTHEAAVADLLDGAVERHGRLDVMVANAGVGRPRPLLEMDLAEWRSVTSVNLDGVFLCTRHAGRVMSATGGGVIVNMCSITAFSGFPMLAHYAAAKAGVRSLTQTAAVELRRAGVRVNCLCPGFVGTDMVEDSKQQFEEMLGLEDFDAAIAAKQGRYGTAEEVARLAVFLASERSVFSTGGAFVLDGGATASLL
jgi:NAD(P)-dependent dehydrogenase (short-subunit alcohol dehydrogenase family)